MQERWHAITLSVPWNLFILTVGGMLYTFALKCVAAPQEFISGGLFGTAMLIVYSTNMFNIAIWFAILNIPVLLLGWLFLSRRFMLYTIYCIVITTLAAEYMPWQVQISDKTLAAVTAGILAGAGSGIALRSLGSDGGTNIISLILHNKYNFSVGSFPLVYNAVLFLLALPFLDIDNILYSMVIVFMSSQLMNYVVGMFNERKLIFIISERYGEIAMTIMNNLGRGCTVLHGQGAFSGRDREVLMAVVHNIQLKRVEELIYQEDPEAFVIIENTQMVIGKGFSKRKKY